MDQAIWKAVGVLAAAGVLAGCTLAVEERDEMAELVYDRFWIVSQIEGVPAAAGVTSTLLIAEDGKVSGNAGCNGYFGSAIIDNDAIAFGNIGATRKACPEPAMGQEDRMLRALDNTRGYRLLEKDLLLLDSGGKTVLRFTQGESV